MLREIESNHIITILVFICALIICANKLIAPARFNEFTYVINNSKYLKVYSRNLKLISAFDILLFLNFILSVTLFFIIVTTPKTQLNLVPLNYITHISLFLAVFFILKYILELFVAYVFDINQMVRYYIFQKLTFKYYIGFILIPLNFIFLFGFSPSPVLVYFIVTLILIFNAIGIITTILLYQKSIFPVLFHFILYLCALEIAPYIILYKVFF